jgi:hypothetical protein
MRYLFGENNDGLENDFTLEVEVWSAFSGYGNPVAAIACGA